METNNLVLNSDGTALISVPQNSVSVIVPDGVKVICNAALHNCTSLKEIIMSNSVTKIGAHAFMGCSSLTNVKLSDNIKEIGCCAFRGCSSLMHIELPESINEIGDLAFYGCTSLKNVFFPQSLTVIKKAAFYGCTSLEMVKLNANIKEILFRAFNVCPALKYIHCGIKNITKAMIDPNAFDTYAFRLCKLIVNDLKECEKHKVFGKFEHTELDSLKKHTTGSPVIDNLVANMVHVEGATYTMGATPMQDQDAFEDEGPAHQVTLSSFFISRYEVTQEEWEAVMGNNPSNTKGEKHPVENVNWDDCQAFIQSLNTMTGMRFRLPTEAEWEFAARGGNLSKGFKYSGSNKIDDVAWYGENSEQKTHPVGQKAPNELDLYDMSGNVWEWCNDWYDDYSFSSQTNPKGPASGSCRVLRGGDWFDLAGCCRVSERHFTSTIIKATNVGFRLVL